MESIWNFEVRRPVFEPLEHDIRTDVLIIGGGMAGLLLFKFFNIMEMGFK